MGSLVKARLTNYSNLMPTEPSYARQRNRIKIYQQVSWSSTESADNLAYDPMIVVVEVSKGCNATLCIHERTYGLLYSSLVFTVCLCYFVPKYVY